MMPIQVISKPDAHQERIVISDFNAPTRKCAAKLMPKEMATAVAERGTDESKLDLRPHRNPAAVFTVVSLNKAPGKLGKVLEGTGKTFRLKDAEKVIGRLSAKGEIKKEKDLEAAASWYVGTLLRLKAIKVAKG